MKYFTLSDGTEVHLVKQVYESTGAYYLGLADKEGVIRLDVTTNGLNNDENTILLDEDFSSDVDLELQLDIIFYVTKRYIGLEFGDYNGLSRKVPKYRINKKVVEEEVPNY